jgi:hypothetical protein
VRGYRFNCGWRQFAATLFREHLEFAQFLRLDIVFVRQGSWGGLQQVEVLRDSNPTTSRESNGNQDHLGVFSAFERESLDVLQAGGEINCGFGHFVGTVVAIPRWLALKRQ